MVHSDISFRKRKFDDGFGFTCMKAAYSLEIKGIMIYGFDSRVVIEAEGDHTKMEEFLMWLKINTKEEKEGIVCLKGVYTGKFSEFDIYRQEYMPAAKKPGQFTSKTR